MKANWCKGLELDEAAEIKGSFMGAKRLRERMKTLVKEKQTHNDKRSRSVEEYESPNWTLKQADSVGYLRAMDEILSLLED